MGTLSTMTQSIIIAIENYVDISLTIDDDEEEINEQIYIDEPPINKASLDGNQHFMPFSMFKQLNWDVINNMPF